MQLQQFTIKSQQAIQKAQQIAYNAKSPAVENSHLLSGLLDIDSSLMDYFFKKLQIQPGHIRSELNKINQLHPKTTGDAATLLSKDANQTILRAQSFLTEFKDEFVTLEHILLALTVGKDQVGKMLQQAGVSEQPLKMAIHELRKGHSAQQANAEGTYQALDKFGKNLNQAAQSGKLDPVIGRDEEIRRVLHILSRRTKNNPMLVGEPGVGKTAIAEGIAHRIVSGDIPENLKSKTIYALDMGALIAGAKFKGEFEERLKAVVNEVIGSEGQIILFIDEIHTLVGAGASEGAMDAANILKPALARGELRAIGATTLNEYQKYFERDKALERRFQKVMIDEPDQEDAISILRGLKERYETHHQVKIKDEAIISAVELSHRYITDRFLPDKAIDLIDEAAAKLRLEMNSLPEELDEVDRKIRQLEIEREAIKRENDESKLAHLNEQIAQWTEERTQWMARWHAEKSLVDEIQNFKSQIETYKTEAEQAERAGDYGRVAELRYGHIREAEEQIVRLEKELGSLDSASRLMKEEVDSEDIAAIVAKWTGIPVAKMLQSEREKLLQLEEELGRRVIGQKHAIEAVSDAIRRSRSGLSDPKKPIGSFIFLGTTGVGKTELAKALADFLFDDETLITRIDMSEFQEQHSVSRLIGAPPGYVGYDEGGQLTEAVRRKPYSVILLDEIEKAHPDVFNVLLQVLDDGRLTDNKGRLVNFKNTIIIMTSNLGSEIIQHHLEEDTDSQRAMRKASGEVLLLLKKAMKPEFLNRIDEILVFHPLTKDEMVEIAAIQIEQLKKQLAENGISLDITPHALQWLAKDGYDLQFGARPLKRLIQKEIINVLSKQLLSGALKKDQSILIDEIDQVLFFRNQDTPKESKTVKTEL